MTSEEAAMADIVMILINDEKQAALYKESIEPNLIGKTLVLLMAYYPFRPHQPPNVVNVIMIAPKGRGTPSVPTSGG